MFRKNLIAQTPTANALTMPKYDTTQIKRYYDRHTSNFLTFGQGRKTGTIHRAVWGPGTSNHQQAFRYIENQIIKFSRSLLPKSDKLHIVDLGCGVGTSLCYIAEHLPILGTGITLSPVQVKLAKQIIDKANLTDRVLCIEGDYSNLPNNTKRADVAYAIESFVHSQDPDQFFVQCSRLIKPGGLLILCDDFRKSETGSAEKKTIERFCKGWHINTLLNLKECYSLADSKGFRHKQTINLSPYLELYRYRDRAARVLLALSQLIPLYKTNIDYLVGGTALQECLKRGWIDYNLVIFQRLNEIKSKKANRGEFNS